MDEIQKIIETFYIPRDIPVFIFRTLLQSIYNVEVTGLELLPKTGELFWFVIIPML